ncbi:hypothetical protein Taro_005210 [Colocasia esculenta]|uniref:Uncharacterized protein n=1 Tax=Colocasia esculenta TaxID=4460 RepID=A0A843TMG1_COLES|nr:hypothetical protein [Colocasia esculenta]
MAADYWLATIPLDADPYRRPHPWTSACGWRPDLWTSIGFTWLRNYPEIPAHLHHSLGHATHVAVPNENDPQETTELFSFGRPKEEKLKSHHHPQREATAPT